MPAPRTVRHHGEPVTSARFRYNAPLLVDGVWTMEVEDLTTRVITQRKFPGGEDAAWAAHTELTQRQHWDKKRAMRGRT
jgi:hypothetical protein